MDHSRSLSFAHLSLTSIILTHMYYNYIVHLSLTSIILTHYFSFITCTCNHFDYYRSLSLIYHSLWSYIHVFSLIVVHLSLTLIIRNHYYCSFINYCDHSRSLLFIYMYPSLCPGHFDHSRSLLFIYRSLWPLPLTIFHL